MLPNFGCIKRKQLNIKIVVPRILWVDKVQEWVGIGKFVNAFATKLRGSNLYSDGILKL